MLKILGTECKSSFEVYSLLKKLSKENYKGNIVIRNRSKKIVAYVSLPLFQRNPIYVVSKGGKSDPSTEVYDLNYIAGKIWKDANGDEARTIDETHESDEFSLFEIDNQVVSMYNSGATLADNPYKQSDPRYLLWESSYNDFLEKKKETV